MLSIDTTSHHIRNIFRGVQHCLFKWLSCKCKKSKIEWQINILQSVQYHTIKAINIFEGYRRQRGLFTLPSVTIRDEYTTGTSVTVIFFIVVSCTSCTTTMIINSSAPFRKRLIDIFINATIWTIDITEKYSRKSLKMSKNKSIGFFLLYLKTKNSTQEK